MHVTFIPCSTGPERLLCEAEVHFEENGPLAGLHLVGFSFWRRANGNGEIAMSCPTQAVFAGGEERFFDYLRGDSAAAQRFKAFILAAFAAFQEQGGLSAASAARQGNARPHAPAHARAPRPSIPGVAARPTRRKCPAEPRRGPSDDAGAA